MRTIRDNKFFDTSHIRARHLLECVNAWGCRFWLFGHIIWYASIKASSRMVWISKCESPIWTYSRQLFGKSFFPHLPAYGFLLDSLFGFTEDALAGK